MNTTDITIQRDFEGYKFTNANVAHATTLIAQEGNNARNSVLRICGIVAMVDEEDFKSEGFNKKFEYLSQVFGVKQSQARLMVRVGEAFIREDKCILGDNQDWTLTQLCELLPIKDTAKQLAESGEVTVDMTAREVKEVVRKYYTPKKSPKRKPKDNTPTISIVAVGPCIVDENGVRGVSLDGGNSIAFTLDGLTDNQLKNRLYKAVRDMLTKAESV